MKIFKAYICKECGTLATIIEGNNFNCATCDSKCLSEMALVENKNEGWQTCPICNGFGYKILSGHSTSVSSICDVCNGKKIISISNGLPPQ